jgi:glycosyltransferase involved in cell wall biosynthesis
LLEDGELRRRLGQNAARYAQNYAWDKIAKQIVEVYREFEGATYKQI